MKNEKEKKTIKDSRIEDILYAIKFGELKEYKITRIESKEVNDIYVQIEINKNYCEILHTINKDASLFINGDGVKYYLNKIDVYNDYIVELENIIKRGNDEIVRLVYNIKQKERLLNAVKECVKSYIALNKTKTNTK